MDVFSSPFGLCGGSLVEGRLKMAVRETKCALILNYLRLLPAQTYKNKVLDSQGKQENINVQFHTVSSFF